MQLSLSPALKGDLAEVVREGGDLRPRGERGAVADVGGEEVVDGGDGNLEVKRGEDFALHLHQVVLLVVVVAAKGEVFGGDVGHVLALARDHQAGRAYKLQLFLLRLWGGF